MCRYGNKTTGSHGMIVYNYPLELYLTANHITLGGPKKSKSADNKMYL